MSVIVGNGLGFDTYGLIDGMRYLDKYAQLFDLNFNEKAESLIGMSKGEIRALKAWMLVLGIIEKSCDGYRLSDLGRTIQAYDPNLKDVGTWWVLHINLAGCHNKTDIWSFYTNHWFTTVPYTESEVTELMAEKCMLHSYATVRKGVTSFIKTATSTPFSKLGIVVDMGEGRYSRRKTENLNEINSTIFTYALVKWFIDYGKDRIAEREIYTVFNSPKRLFFLTKEGTDILLGEAYAKFDRRVVSCTSDDKGKRIITVEYRNLLKLLEIYYLERGGKVSERAIAEIF